MLVVINSEVYNYTCHSTCLAKGKVVTINGSGSFFNPDHSELCDNLDLLLVLGGKVDSPQEKERITQHIEMCTWCARSGRSRSLIDICFSPQAEQELRAKLETAFGRIEWSS